MDCVNRPMDYSNLLTNCRIDVAMTVHKCKSHEEWIQNIHYMCSCGHVEWAHYGDRLNKDRCAHCNCTRYIGETRPLTDYEIRQQGTPQQEIN